MFPFPRRLRRRFSLFFCAGAPGAMLFWQFTEHLAREGISWCGVARREAKFGLVGLALPWLCLLWLCFARLGRKGIVQPRLLTLETWSGNLSCLSFGWSGVDGTRQQPVSRSGGPQRSRRSPSGTASSDGPGTRGERERLPSAPGFLGEQRKWTGLGSWRRRRSKVAGPVSAQQPYLAGSPSDIIVPD
eukprot:gene23910-biopygen22346